MGFTSPTHTSVLPKRDTTIRPITTRSPLYLIFHLDLPQALASLHATNFHVAPDLIELLLANDAKRRKSLPPTAD
jgi:hypothetical protein